MYYPFYWKNVVTHVSKEAPLQLSDLYLLTLNLWIADCIMDSWWLPMHTGVTWRFYPFSLKTHINHEKILQRQKTEIGLFKDFEQSVVFVPRL